MPWKLGGRSSCSDRARHLHVHHDIWIDDEVGMDSLVLQTVIGVVFLFATVAGLVSLLTETISRFLGLRGEYLLRGLRTMLDGGGKFNLEWADIIPHTSKGKERLANKRDMEKATEI